MLINYLDYEVVKSGLKLNFTVLLPESQQLYIRLLDKLALEFETDKVVNSLGLPFFQKDYVSEEESVFYFEGLVEYNSVVIATVEELRKIHSTITYSSKEKLDKCFFGLYKNINVLKLYVLQI